MKLFNVKNIKLAAFGLFFASSAAFATDVTLDLNVSGTILGAPEWRNTGATQITSVTFDFGSYQAGDAARNVDSGSQSVVLYDPANSSGSLSVTLATPSGCSIGADNITDSDVKLMFNSTEQANAASISITEGATNAMELRFASSGNYGDKSGAVSCSSAGTLTYTY